MKNQKKEESRKSRYYTPTAEVRRGSNVGKVYRGHPALILGEEKDDYRFRRVTSSEKSGHHRNEKIEPNPDKRRSTPMYIVKQQQTDKKIYFGKRYPWKFPKK